MINIKTLLAFLLLCISASNPVFGQNTIKTNIDSSIINPKWMTNALKAGYYRNGEPIQRVTDIKDWSNKMQKSVRGLYYIHVTEAGDSVYLYNWSAVSNTDKGGIAPFGYRMPTARDFEVLRNNRKLSVSPGFPILHFVTTDLGGKKRVDMVYDTLCIDTFFVGLPYSLNRDGNQISKGEYGFWLATSYADAFNDKNSELALESAALAQYSNGSLGLSFANREYGYSAICIQNMDEVLKSSNYGYNLLLPKEYNRLKDSLFNYVLLNEKRYKSDLYSRYKATLKSQFEFNKSGSNVSTSFQFVTGKSTLYKYGFIDELSRFVKDWDIFPYYNSNAVSTRMDLDLTIMSKIKSNERFNSNRINKESINQESAILSELRKVEKFKDIMKMEVTTVTVMMDKDTLERSYLSSVNAPGPGNAFLFPIPGLGFSQVNGKRIPLWLLGIASGLVASFSYIQKEDYYDTYTESGYLDEGAYDNADMYNKAFWVSSGVFVGLSAFDITYTILKGVNNRKKANRLNQWLEKTPEPVLLYPN
jgi:hypothetical protein